MAYNNRMPVLSRIDKGVRDNDFIPISELKEFDKKLNKIIELFESTKNTDTSDANSLAKKMKDIEYNMADALVFDENNNIIGYNTITTDDGKEIPKYGPDAIYNMLNTLEEYYGNFVTLMGSDPNIDNWKIDLDAYFTEAITLFKNKLNGVFRNSALAATMEAKNDKTNDYILNDKVSLKKGQIMRLNPDLQSYIRNVNLLPSEQNTDFIAFEVGELEKDSLVFNLKIQNGFMWVNLNVVLDNGKWFISREKVLGKELENKFKINVFKYKNGDKTFYVFCLNTDYPELDEYYNFEIEGLLVNGYSFNATGLTVDKHNKYYSYTLVEDTSVDPLYNETYYTKSSEEYTDENGAKITREIYIPETHLTVFREGVEYYVRSVNFSFIHSFDFINDELDGNINKDDVLKDKNNQLVVEDIKYRGTNKALKVDYEVSEVFDDNEEADTNNYIANENKLKEDDSVRLYNNEQSLVAVGKSPKKIDNRIAVAYGEKTFDIVDLRPGDVVNTNSYLDRDASNTVYNDIHGNIERLENGELIETILNDDTTLNKNNFLKFPNGNAIYIKYDGTIHFKSNEWSVKKDLFTAKLPDTTPFIIADHNDKYIIVTCNDIKSDYNMTNNRGFNFTLGYKTYVYCIFLTDNYEYDHLEPIYGNNSTYDSYLNNWKADVLLHNDMLFVLSGRGDPGYHGEVGSSVGACRNESNAKLKIINLKDKTYKRINIPYLLGRQKTDQNVSNVTNLNSKINQYFSNNFFSADTNNSRKITNRELKLLTVFDDGYSIGTSGHPILFISLNVTGKYINTNDVHSHTIWAVKYEDVLDKTNEYENTSSSNPVVLTNSDWGNIGLCKLSCGVDDVPYYIDEKNKTVILGGVPDCDRVTANNYIGISGMPFRSTILLKNGNPTVIHIPNFNIYDNKYKINETDLRYVILGKGQSIVLGNVTNYSYLIRRINFDLFNEPKNDENGDYYNYTEPDANMYSTTNATFIIKDYGSNKLYVSGGGSTYFIDEINKEFVEVKTIDDTKIYTTAKLNTDDVLFVSQNEGLFTHGDKYTPVDTLTQPDPNTVYYTLNESNQYVRHEAGTVTEWGEVYSKVDTSTPPDPNTIYYSKTTNGDYTNGSTVTNWEYIYTKVDVSETPNPIEGVDYYTKDANTENYTLAENLENFSLNKEYYTRELREYYIKTIKNYYTLEENQLIELLPDITNKGKYINTFNFEKRSQDDSVVQSRSYIVCENKIIVRTIVIQPDSDPTVEIKVLINTEGSIILKEDLSTLQGKLYRTYGGLVNVFRLNDEYDIVEYKYKNSGKNALDAYFVNINDFSIEKINLPSELTNGVFLNDRESAEILNNLYVSGNNSLCQILQDKTIKKIISKNTSNVCEIETTGEKLFFTSDTNDGTTNYSLVELFKFVKNVDFANFTSDGNPNVYSSDKLYVTTNEVFKYDLMQDPTILDNLIKSNDPILSKKCQTINEYIKNNLVFVNSFRVGILKRSENTVDIIIIPDNADVANGDFYMLFTVNISTDILNKDATERTIVFRKLTKSEDEFVGKKILYQEKWTSICSNNIITLAIGKNGLFYSYNSDVFHRLVKPMTENTHEEIIFDDSFEVFYDNFLYFYAVKVNKKSTDHTYYYSKDGIIWKKSNMDIIFPDMKDQPYYPKIYTTGLNRIFFVGEYGSILVDNVGLENITSKYTEAYVTQEEVQYYDPIHSYNLGFDCTDLFFDNNRYFALDSTNHQLKYAETTSNLVDIKELFTSWTTVTVNDLDLSGDKIKDYKLYGYDLRGVIVYGSGKTDPTAIGLWYSAWNAPGTFTKSNLPSDIGVKAFYPCVSIWKQENGSEVSKDYIYLLGTDDKTYKSEDFGHTWTEEAGTREVLHVGSYNNYYIIKNTDTGVITGRSLDGLPTIASDFTSPLVDPKACMSRNLHATVGYNIIHVTDNNTGKILFTTDYEHWYPASVISYNPVTELRDSGNLVVGNTVMYPIAINKDYDESYCPTKDTNAHKKKFINDNYNFITLDDDGFIELHINNDKYTIGNSNGINPNDFLIATLSNSKIRYCFISEYNKGIWISDEVVPGTFSGTLTHIDLDIYVENGFQNRDGFFIYGKDDNNKTKLYYLQTRKLNLAEFEFVEKLSVDFIDYIKPHNDDIVVSTYDFENPYDKYSYKPETKEFIKSTAIDISDVYSFNNTFEYKGDLFFINGSGTNTSIRNNVDNNEGVFMIRKSVDTLGNIEYNITPFVKNSEIYKDISPIDKIYTGVLQVEKDKFILVTSGKKQDNSDFVTNKFIIDFAAINVEDKLKKIENVNRYDNPVLHDIGEIIDTENLNSHIVNEQNRRTSVTNIPSFGLIVQRHSFGCDINDLNDDNLSLENKVDSYYFDKENKTIKLNSYGVSGRTDFKLNSEKIAFASTVNTNKSAIIMALGQDNAFGIFDKDNKCIKVVKTGYTDRTTGQDIFIEFDPKYVNMQSVIIGRNNTDLHVYGLFYGKFPRFNYDVDTGERYLDYSQSITVYKVFSIGYDSLMSANGSISINEEKNFTYDISQNEIRINLKNYIKNQGYLPSEDLNLTDSDIQVIAISNNIVYENTYSMIVWNSKNKCLQAYTKFQYDSSLDNPNEESGVNQKIGSNVEGLDFERNSLYVDIAEPTTERTTMKFMKFGSTDDSYIETNLFVANLTNRKNLFFTNADDYKRDILFDSTKYLKYMQTRYGVFRYTSKDYVNAVNKRLNTNFEFDESNFNYINNAPRTYRNVESMFYFTPEGSSSIIPIHIGNKGCVTDIWEMGEAIFVQTREYIEYIFDEQEVYKLYKLIMIPDSNRSEIISIHDPRYFVEMDTKYARIYDMKNTLNGLICVGIEPKGITDTNHIGDYGNSYVFWYNGNDFVVVKMFDINGDPGYYYMPEYILNTVDGSLLLSSRSTAIYKYSKATNTVEKDTEYHYIPVNFPGNTGSPLDSVYLLEEFVKNQRLEPNYPTPILDILTEDTIIYTPYLYYRDPHDYEHYYWYLVEFNLTKKTTRIIKNYGEVDRSNRGTSTTQAFVRYPIVRPSDTTRQYNSDLIKNILSQKIPVDKTLKVIGSLICDGVRFNVSAMHIETHTGVNNKTFKTLVFNIDKHFRSDLSKEIFTESPGTIRFGFGEIDRNIQKLNIIIFY